MLDCHVHIIGNGSGGSGCWLKLKSSYHKLLARFALKNFGLSPDALTSNLEEQYVVRLLQMVATSSLKHVCIFAHEQPYREDGSLIENFGSFYVPNDYVLSLAERHREFLAVVSIHPARADALDELARCKKQGAVMLKLLPNCQNVDCNNPKYKIFWEHLAETGLPLLAHSGGELSVPVYNAAYADPRTFRLPLACGVKVIAAHCGTSSLLFDPNYVSVMKEMVKQYPNLYGDNSGMSTPLRCRHFPELLKEPLVSRIVHGSDLPIPISPVWSRLWRQISAKDYSAIKQLDTGRLPNPLERDVRIKRALGFPDETFTRLYSLLPSYVGNS